MEKITIKGVLKDYKIIIDHSILNKEIDFLSNYNKIMFLVDKNVDKELYKKLDLYLACKNVIRIETLGTEDTKSFEFYQKVLNVLIENNFAKDDLILALGGGTTLDLAGFVASTYKRSINLIYLPSSLLAMVDVCVGSKNGINYHGIKNVVGSFYDPSLVVIDPNLLLSLDREQYYSGLCEVLKMSLLEDGDLLDRLLQDNYTDELLIYRSILIKKEFVENDPYDTSYRHGLNLGHSYGHAIEAISNYKISHGIAVGQGLLFILEGKLLDTIKKILTKWKIKPSIYKESELEPYLLNDKKNNNDKINLVTLKEKSVFIVEGKEYHYGKHDWK